MPLASKRSRAAKHIHQNAQMTFAQPAPCTASPGVLEYIPSDSDSGSSAFDPESGDEWGTQGQNAVGISVEALQCLYSAALPPHLHLEEK